MSRPRRVVTLPPGLPPEEARAFARAVRTAGAELLELRTDLHPSSLDVEALAAELPLLVAEREAPLPQAWRAAASVVDVPLPGGPPQAPGADGGPLLLVSEHFPEPLPLHLALAAWREVPPGVSIKHVEPLGGVERLPALLGLQTQLLRRFGEGRVTVLVTGPWALPVRAVLARRNALDYLAAGPRQASAPGQRLLEDAVRAARAAPECLRLGILGTSIAHSRSPRFHPPPFDRIDVPPEAPVEALVDALLPHYRGFAVTSPFKKRLARHVGAPLEAINTLWREGGRWHAANTDVEGAGRCLQALGPAPWWVLGDGGAAAAVRLAGGDGVQVLRRAEVGDSPLSGHGVWTWPDAVEAPASLRFAPGTRVAVIAYGAPGRRIAAEVERRGGTPVRLGARWFIAQARAQRSLWAQAT